jgi:divalent metal cation (Fe/Co/Zn/Cd) transporter
MNVAAIVFPIIAYYQHKVWWIDPAGGLAISAYILYRWYDVAMEQVQFIVGITAPEEFIDEVKAVAGNHHLKMHLIQVVAYHCGQGYIVEVEMMMDEQAMLGDTNSR